MPLLPLPVLRVFEGLMAVVCIIGVLVSVGAWLLVMQGAGPAEMNVGHTELFGILVTPTGAFAAIVASVLGAIWFGVNAIRGGLSQTDECDKPRVIDPE
jgi:hypothetical protein